MAVTDWQEEARDLRAQGMSEREIAEVVGKAASTVHAAVKDVELHEDLGAAQNGHEPDVLERLGGNTIEGNTFEGNMIVGQQTIDGQEVSVPVEEIRVDGTAQLGLFQAGGKQPQSASLRLSGGKVLLVDGQAFRKGDTISFSGTAVVREVGQRDKPDPATGIVVSAEQKHVAQITDLRVNG